MATYYVRKTGSDGAAGTSAGAAWATVGKALGASGAANGDTVYIGAGTYRETITCATSGITVIGDVDGAKTGDAGMVQVTGHTTNDKTIGPASATITLAGFDNLTFQRLWIVGSSGVNYPNAACIDASTSTSTGITLNDCAFSTTGSVSPGNNVVINSAASTALNWTCDRCIFYNSTSLAFLITPTGVAGADWDLNCIWRNCTFMAVGAVQVNGSASTGNGGGCRFYNCNSLTTVCTNGSNTNALKFPSKVFNCFIFGGTTAALVAGNRGEIIGDYNMILAGGSSGGVNSVGDNTHDKYDGSYSLSMLSFGQEYVWGGRTRPFLEPSDGSPLLGWNSGADGQGGLPATTADDATVGTVAWTSVGNGATKDGVFATASLALNAVSHYAKMTNFGFNLPSDATVVGVSAVAWAKAGTTNRIQDQNVKLVKGGTIGGNDKGTAATKLTAAVTSQLWGASNDLWGNTFLYSDINASTFGVAIAYKNTNASTTVVSLDGVYLYVFYTTPSAGLTVDVRNAPRPAGGGSIIQSVGALERANTWGKETGTVRTGSNAWSITGPGYQDFEVPIDATSRTLSFYMRYDGTYDTTNGKPQLSVLANGEIGVSLTAQAMTGASGQWELVSVTINPSAAGIVTLRIESRDKNGGGKAFADDYAFV